MKNNHRDDNYIEELTEWQEKQFLPGEYLGGKVPPYIKWPTRNLGYFFLFTGIIGLTVTGATIITDLPQALSAENIMGSFIPFIFMVIYTVAGIRILRKQK